MVALVLGYPIAVFLVTYHNLVARFTVVVLLSPLFVSVAVRAYSWNVTFAPSGPLGGLGLNFTESAVVIGLVQYLLPFAVLSLIVSLSSIEPALARAALTLGAGPVEVFRTITLPLSTPGIVSAVLISFTTGMTAFAIPLLLGGGKMHVLVSLIYEQQMGVFNQGFAATASVILLAISLAVVVIMNWLSWRLQRGVNA